MAAFTTFSEQALSRYLVMFGRGDLAHHEPIEGGIENSNYRVTLLSNGDNQHYILTIIEGLGFHEIAFFNKVMTHLYQNGLPVAAPLATLDGMTSTIFCSKPTFLFPRLDGTHLETISESQCEAIGQFMARAHLALSELSSERENPYGHDWMTRSITQLAPRLNQDDQQLLSTLADEYGQILSADVPRGIIHGDLFQDNALFRDNGELSGVIDFYHACNDLLIQDIAIAINDWCAIDNVIVQSMKQALIDGYESVRALTDQEHQVLPRLQRVSAGRFALTRLLSGDPPLKDPNAMLGLARSLA